MRTAIVWKQFKDLKPRQNFIYEIDRRRYVFIKFQEVLQNQAGQKFNAICVDDGRLFFIPATKEIPVQSGE
jgi:hypothetical protein